jgi:hypothetical protein
MTAAMTVFAAMARGLAGTTETGDRLMRDTDRVGTLIFSTRPTHPIETVLRAASRAGPLLFPHRGYGTSDRVSPERLRKTWRMMRGTREKNSVLLQT